MTSMIEGAKRLVGRGGGLAHRVEGLARAAEAGRGRLSEEAVAEAEGVVSRTGDRLRLTSHHTVVAIAGATGSGKSSTFNALTGLDLAAVGVRRPTTSWATACVWGEDGAEELMDWLGIPPRHVVMRDSMLDDAPAPSGPDLRGVVLLDLPDHDSTEVSHHLEVDRLVRQADLFVWVLDPQKYADAAIHRRYLQPLSGHKDVMLVVLNHVDTVAADRRRTMLDDVRRLLDADGLTGVPVLATSALTGEGVPALRAEIAKRAASKKTVRTRLEQDVKAVATRLRAESGTAPSPAIGDARLAGVNDAFADAAGVPTVVAAVAASTRVRANRATGWPVVAWLTRLKPDPLRRLHLDLPAAGKVLTGAARTSLPEPTGVQRARVDTEIRALADDVSEPLTRPWQSAIRRASVADLGAVSDRLDRAVATTDLGAERLPGWARGIRVVQWALICSALAGAAWLAAIAGLAYLMPGSGLTLPTYPWHEIPLPTLLLAGGVGLGVVLALLSRFLVGLAARSRARRADRRLRRAISEVTAESVAAPIERELAAYRQVSEGLRDALR